MSKSRLPVLLAGAFVLAPALAMGATVPPPPKPPPPPPPPCSTVCPPVSPKVTDSGPMLPPSFPAP